VPPDIAPMLPTVGVPPSVAGWVAEPKLDGWRARLLVDTDVVVVRTRRGNDVSEAVPAALALRDAGLSVVLDGELVAGRGTLAEFYRVGPAVARKGRGQAVTFVAFDCVWHDGELLTGRPHVERRELLDRLGLAALGVPVVPSLDGLDAALLFTACDQLGVEGVVLKRSASLYWPGRRTPDWKKVKVRAWREHMERRIRERH
jgi:bifunctional non-homologous end joining protein LigD